MIEIEITQNEAGQRADRFLRKYLVNAPLSEIYKLLRKDIKLGGKRVKENYMLCEGDVLCLYITEEELSRYAEKKQKARAKKQFTVLYEDENLIAVSKPFGLLVHGDKSEKKDTLANQVLSYLIEKGDYVPRLEKSFTPSPVHRIDRNTTGIVVFGKNAAALRLLTAMFRDDDCVRKTYYTVVCGELKEELHLKNRLLKDEKRNVSRVLPETAAEGKYIETIARPLSAGGGFTLAEIELVTGRTHQIRAHMAYAGFPLAGDSKYGGRPIRRERTDGTPVPGVSTQLLHAGKIKFPRPADELAYLKDIEITAPVPAFWPDIERELFGKEIL